MRKIMVIGASANPSRFSNKAVQLLLQKKFDVVPVGRSEGKIGQLSILTQPPPDSDIDTVLIYLNPKNQEPYYDYLLQLQPKQIIFNPGAANDHFASIAQKQGIKVENACSLVLIIGNLL